MLKFHSERGAYYFDFNTKMLNYAIPNPYVPYSFLKKTQIN